MVAEELAAQTPAVEMQVDLRGLYRLVAQHLLDGPQIGAPLQQMGGE